MPYRKVHVLALGCLLGMAWTVAAQSVEAVESQLIAIKADAQAVLDRNATLGKRSKLPLWVSDAQARIVASASAALLDLAQVRLRFNGSASGWVAPLGIPVPPWPAAGIDLARPTFPSPWSSDQAGYYFIETAGCSDARTYGNPTASRCTVPGTLAAGAVVVFHGTIATSYSSPNDWDHDGTSGSPIWYMGYDTGNRPTFTGALELTNASYAIVDNINLSWNAANGMGVSGDHLLLRHMSVSNPYETPSNGAAIGISGADDVVVYDIAVTKSGSADWVGGDIDRVGLKIDATSTDIWVVDSSFTDCQSDGLAIGNASNAVTDIQRIYIGRNTSYDNLQGGFWVKNATDVIFSSNVAYNQTRVGGGGGGHGMGGQYDPDYVWFINNRIYNSLVGIAIAGADGGGAAGWYAIGNLLYTITAEGACNENNAGALIFYNDGPFTAIFNTIYDVAFFMGIPASGGTTTANHNIFDSKRPNGCSAFELSETITHDYNLFTVSGYDPGTEANRVVGDPLFVTAGSNFALQSGSPALNVGNVTEEAAFATFQSRYGLDIRKDIAGTVRPQATRYDLGAYERTP